MNETESMTHVFLKPCGCLFGAVLDVPEMFAELASQYRYAKKCGLTYKKIPSQEVRTMGWKCPQHKRIST